MFAVENSVTITLLPDASIATELKYLGGPSKFVIVVTLEPGVLIKVLVAKKFVVWTELDAYASLTKRFDVWTELDAKTSPPIFLKSAEFKDPPKPTATNKLSEGDHVTLFQSAPSTLEIGILGAYQF